MEDIKADNNQVASIIDIEKGEIFFTVLMKSFKFERALMEEHFNENYAESDKFPKATFKGKITNLSSVDFKKPGVYNLEIEGDMTIHGVTKPHKAKGTLEVKGENLLAKAKFNISIKEYGIIIPDLVKDKIQDSMEITVDMDYTLLKK
jgi:polyisoprenoid-binding protein YceI